MSNLFYVDLSSDIIAGDLQLAQEMGMVLSISIIITIGNIYMDNSLLTLCMETFHRYRTFTGITCEQTRGDYGNRIQGSRRRRIHSVNI
jgi:hypothetical protein